MRTAPVALAAAVILAWTAAAPAQTREPSKALDLDSVYKQAMEDHKAGRYVAAEKGYRTVLEARPDDATLHLNLGTLLIGVWRYEEGARHFRRTLELNPACSDAYVWLARTHFNTYEYKQALRCIEKALSIEPRNPKAHGIHGFLLIRLDLYKEAGAAFDRALSYDGKNNLAVLGRAHLCRLRKEYKVAARELAALLRRAPLNASAYQELGMTLSSMGRTYDGLKVVNRGIRANPFLPTLYTSRAFLLFKLRWAKGSADAYRKALEIDPEYTGGHGIYSYFRTASLGASAANPLFREGDRHLRQGRFQEAEALFRRALAEDPNHHHAWLGLGACRFARRDYEGVLSAARNALVTRKDSPLAHNLFLAGKTLKAESKRTEVSPVDYYGIFRKQPDRVVPGVDAVFTNYTALDGDLRKAVNLTAWPLRRYVPVLAKKGVTHVILPLNRHLTDLKSMERWRGVKTFDDRYYDSVRGVAGRGKLTVAVTGLESLWEATRMRYNTLAHEFAHQVHEHALDGAQRTTIKALYQRAKKRRTFLDYYSRTDEYEYFAQGYEAYVSQIKRPSTSETHGNTRAHLRKRDPGLLEFIESLTGGGG